MPHPKLPLTNYGQQDYHSCGFVAALTVARYFNPRVPARDVLSAVKPTQCAGVDRHDLLSGLFQLDIYAEYRTDLTVKELRELVAQGIPVIISVWPDGWYLDHWTVVQTVSEDQVYLMNHETLTLDKFRQEWSDMDMRSQGNSGEGFVCLGMPNFPLPLPPEAQEGP